MAFSFVLPFRCYECKEIFEEKDKCFLDDGKLWCESHYLKNCSGCNIKINTKEWVSSD